MTPVACIFMRNSSPVKLEVRPPKQGRHYQPVPLLQHLTSWPVEANLWSNMWNMYPSGQPNTPATKATSKILPRQYPFQTSQLFLVQVESD
jgi:hypothetical protein